MKIPGFIIAGTNSGCGKTTISTGVMGALSKKGFNVQPFKVGPDYIDPMYHTFITSNHSRNLDEWLLDPEILKYLFVKNSSSKDISVIEGVMGLYDGISNTSSQCSTASMSKLLDCPVILVVNGEGMSNSISAIIKGYCDFDKEVNIKGVIINNIKTKYHYSLLKESIEYNTDVKVLGYVEKLSEIDIPSRHLGLYQSSEIDNLKEKIDYISDKILETVDINSLIEISKNTKKININSIEPSLNLTTTNANIRIAIAKDKAFSFYYKDNLDLLEKMGVELIPFSPINSSNLPEDISGLYIGGGYPEVYAKALQDNLSIRTNLKTSIAKGLPVYAECGGYMYLTNSLKTKENNVFEMVGAINGFSEMTKRLQNFGYFDVDFLHDTLISKKGSTTKSHEFHYSKTTLIEPYTNCVKLEKKYRKTNSKLHFCGYKQYNIYAGYPHLHFWSNPEVANEFINNCVEYNKNR